MWLSRAPGNLCTSNCALLSLQKIRKKIADPGPIRYSSFRFRVTQCTLCRGSLVEITR